MIDIEKVEELQLINQYIKFRHQLYTNQASAWLSIGVISSIDNPQNLGLNAYVKAFRDLGVDYYSIPKQTKWFEFWKSENEMKILQALKQIKAQ